VEDLSVLDEIAKIVSSYELETEFSKAFSSGKEMSTSTMMKRWTAAETQVDKFLQHINELYKISVRRDTDKSKSTGSVNLHTLVKQLKLLL